MILFSRNFLGGDFVNSQCTDLDISITSLFHRQKLEERLALDIEERLRSCSSLGTRTT
jgi:hypothetical protein